MVFFSGFIIYIFPTSSCFIDGKYAANKFVHEKNKDYFFREIDNRKIFMQRILSWQHPF